MAKEEISDEEFTEAKNENIAKIRYKSIDIFRGIIIVFMILLNPLFQYDNLPWWSNHIANLGRTYGLTYIDLGAPYFILAITLTYVMSFNHRVKRDGYLQTYIHFLRRYGAFLGFGMLGSIILTAEGFKFGWGVLQAIGFAGIATLAFVKLPRYIRLAIGMVFLLGYQAVLSIPINVEGNVIALAELNDLSLHGGIIGSIGYAILTILGTAIVDDFETLNKNQLPIYGSTALVLGVAWHYCWVLWDFPPFGGISKSIVTPSFVLVSLGSGLIFFWLLWLIFDDKEWIKPKGKILQPIGKNAFFMYIVHPIFILLIAIAIPKDAHLVWLIVGGVVSICLAWGIAFIMDKYKIYITI